MFYIFISVYVSMYVCVYYMAILSILFVQFIIVNGRCGVRISAGTRHFSVLPTVQTCCGPHPASYLLVSGFFFLEI